MQYDVLANGVQMSKYADLILTSIYDARNEDYPGIEDMPVEKVIRELNEYHVMQGKATFQLPATEILINVGSRNQLHLKSGLLHELKVNMI